MHKCLKLATSALLVGAAHWPVSAADLSVTFIQPERYADAAYSRSFGGEKERAEVQRDIEQHLQRLAERQLPPGQALAIEVLDIDLAGEFEPFRLRAGTDVRIVRDATGPRMTLRYTLTRGDQVLAKTEERLTDLGYLMSMNRYSGSDRLRYEKAMLDHWFERRITSAR